MKLLTCMSIAGSIPVVICLLMYLIQHADYNYTLGRRLLITGIFFYLMPVQLIKISDSKRCISNIYADHR